MQLPADAVCRHMKRINRLVERTALSDDKEIVGAVWEPTIAMLLVMGCLCLAEEQKALNLNFPGGPLGSRSWRKHEMIYGVNTERMLAQQLETLSTMAERLADSVLIAKQLPETTTRTALATPGGGYSAPLGTGRDGEYVSSALPEYDDDSEDSVDGDSIWSNESDFEKEALSIWDMQDPPIKMPLAQHDGPTAASLAYLNGNYGREASIFTEPLPSPADTRFPASPLEVDSLARGTVNLSLHWVLRRLSGLSVSVPSRLLVKLARSLLDRLGTDGETDHRPAMTATKQLASGNRPILSLAIQEGLRLQQEGAQKTEGKSQALQITEPMVAPDTQSAVIKSLVQTRVHTGDLVRRAKITDTPE
ncbi:hypothetical protein DL770_003351 [Monosporascus sp. CRB-9-2]|nr:hypothetical protein DL770_003351 [Monosporascus sp. CRB-9-2]